MKRKYAEPKDHKAIDDYDFYNEYIDIDGYSGYISIINIKTVKDEWYVPRNNGEQVCILNKNYQWLVFYPDNQKYVITAIYNDKKEVAEWYFDMVKEIGTTKDGMPYMDDLYLDLVISKEGDFYILDEDELKNALNEKDITKEDYKLAYDTLDMLTQKYSDKSNIEKLSNFTDKYLELLSNKIKIKTSI